MSIGYGWLNPDTEKLESSLVKGRKVLSGVYKGKTRLRYSYKIEKQNEKVIH